MMQLLRYLFWPNPGFASYSDPGMIALLTMCAVLIVGSFFIRVWRRKQKNAIARKLSGSWAFSAFWFGMTGLILVVSRVEDIQFFAMRFMWVIWGACVLAYLYFQMRRWRVQHYEVLPTAVTHDPRDQYLPKKKRK